MNTEIFIYFFSVDPTAIITPAKAAKLFESGVVPAAITEAITPLNATIRPAETKEQEAARLKAEQRQRLEELAAVHAAEEERRRREAAEGKHKPKTEEEVCLWHCGM